MGKLRCIAVCLFALAAAACEAAAPKGLQTADGKGLCKYAGALRFAGRYATNLAQEAERRAATAGAVKQLASLAEHLAAPLDGKATPITSAIEVLQGAPAEEAGKELHEHARLARQAARALTFASGSLRSFVEVLAAMGTSVHTGGSYSCIDGDTQIRGGSLGETTNANTLREEACAEVKNQTGQQAEALRDSDVKEALAELRAGRTLRGTNGRVGAKVTPSAGAAECRLLAIAGEQSAGAGGLLLKDTGNEGDEQNTVHLGTFVKISALNGGSASFDKQRNLTDGMDVESALQAIERAQAALENHRAFACSEDTCPALEEAKRTLRRTVAAIQHAEERDKNAQKEERSALERTEKQIKERLDSANEETGTQAEGHTETAQTGYTASDASQGVPFAATLAVAAGAATTHFVPQQAARH
ncbi:hypothetical protein ERJ75_001032600 [Trypanosoma vivax]|uniref:Uncharacterized protein n=1 Tax=Trypanosoma vivax (strain Y486) TaxID=1055687 RepID=F9WVM8_TRYVY|nr:hypothetical protein ERJ75_001032600 [Trypanosoma vivax]CCD21636.1 hypothetical protein, conserved in T. vivax [Trypanosoma vivax Y486]|eukprot:CCD21636.1 hypothetical protein, conserved in T. vivax [Trypanosoma vivax Y486]